MSFLFLPFYRAWAWKCLLTEIEGDLEALWQAHHFSEYDCYNSHQSTKETVAASLYLNSY